MNRQVIPSMLLSVLIVTFFSILLYEKERPEKDGQPASPAPTPEPGKAKTSPAPPEPAAGLERSAATAAPEPAPTPKPAAPAPPAVPPPATGVTTPAPQPDSATPGSARDAKSATPPPKPPPSGGQGPFTTVKPGESLEDVSVRVYGSADPLDALWRANRDLLPRKDSPLPAGSVLRTPKS